MKIIEYQEKYRESVCFLFVQLQRHLVDVDPEKVQMLHETYCNEYCDYVLQLLKQHSGKMYLAAENGMIVGLVAGYIEEKDEEDRLTNRCPVRGIISELVVHRHFRNAGVGSLLMDSIESYLKDQNCEYIAVNVFEPNEGALKFYHSRQYAPRNIEMIKPIFDITKKLLKTHCDQDCEIYEIFDPALIYEKGHATEEDFRYIDLYIDEVCRDAELTIDKMWARGKGIAYLSAFLINQREMERFQKILNAFHGNILLSIIPETDQFIMEILIENIDDEEYILDLLNNDPVLDKEMDFSVNEDLLRPAFKTKKYKVVEWLYWAGIDDDPICGDTHPLIYAMQINDFAFACAYIDGMLRREEMDFDVETPGDGKCLVYAVTYKLQDYVELFLTKGACAEVFIDGQSLFDIADDGIKAIFRKYGESD